MYVKCILSSVLTTDSSLPLITRRTKHECLYHWDEMSNEEPRTT